jgi:hypothetical protein
MNGLSAARSKRVIGQDLLSPLCGLGEAFDQHWEPHGAFKHAALGQGFANTRTSFSFL